MPESKLVAQFTKGGRRPRPYGYSYLSKRLPSEEKIRIVRYIEGVRSGLVADLGPTEADLSTMQLVLIDRLCCLLAICRALEQHFEENVMEGDSLKAALRESYISYNNSIRLILTTLGLEKIPMDHAISPLDYIRRYDERKSKKDEG